MQFLAQDGTDRWDVSPQNSRFNSQFNAKSNKANLRTTKII
jgi:hypothetical protein